MSQELSQAVIQRAPLIGDRSIPLWRYMMVIQVVLALFPTAAFGDKGGYVAVFLVSFVASWLIWGIGIPFIVLRMSSESVVTQIRQETRTALQRWAGKPLLAQDYSTAANRRRKTTGSAIAYDGDCLYVVDQGEVARIPAEAVRSWRWYAPGAQRVELFGKARGDGAALVDTAWTNARLASEAHEASGMTIAVDDLERPVWRFTCSDVQVLEKWDEILNQVAAGSAV